MCGAAAGLLISTVTTPVGVSGAVFLLPVQLSVFGVPNPAVTPTNLLFNVVAGPGALWRYRRDGALRGGLARRLVLWHAARRHRRRRRPRLRPPRPGRLPAPDRRPAAAARRMAVPARPAPGPPPAAARGRAWRPRSPPSPWQSEWSAGIYGIGGGSLLGPILVARGMPMARIAPATLAATFTTSAAGAAAYAVLALASSGPVAPDWWLGLGLRPRRPDRRLPRRQAPALPARNRALRLLLGTLAAALGALYAAEAVS